MRTLSVISSSSASGSSAGSFQCLSDVVDEIGLGELPRGQVHRHEQWRGARGSTASRSRSRPVDTRLRAPSARVARSRPVSSAIGMNASGGTRPRVGCCHRTSASNPTTVPSASDHDRLVMDAELVAIERAAEVVLEVEPLERLIAHRRLEQEMTLAGVALGADHRDLGLAQEFVGRRRGRVSRARCPMRRGEEPVPPVERERLAQLACDPIRDLVRLRGVHDRVEHERELVAAEPRDRVTRAGGCGRDADPPPSAACPRRHARGVSLTTLNRSRSSRITPIEASSSGRWPASACAMRSDSSSRFGQARSSGRRERRAGRHRRVARSRAPIDASRAKLVSASMSRSDQRRADVTGRQTQHSDDPARRPERRRRSSRRARVGGFGPDDRPSAS